MICEKCQPELEADPAKIGEATGRVELCAKHALVNRLAEQLARQHDQGCNNPACSALMVLAEYDAAKGK